MARSRADQLVKELTDKVGLEPVDAHRSAFTALACSRRWTKARVGRYLGISRARVGQKFDKLLQYATTRDDCPVLTEVMKDAYGKKSKAGAYDEQIAFEQDQWNDLQFAKSLLDRVA